ncbi:MAG: ThuA domain-containing protein [Chloroflexi bacterium]|nr:ThuA domain-containing protein [Chloroflexota bacterium]
MTAPRVLFLAGQPVTVTVRHNDPEHWASFGSMLRSVDASARVFTDDVNLLTASVLADIDVVVNANSTANATDEQIEALLLRISDGAGFVGVHAASATFLAHPRYLEMVGSQFRRHHTIKAFTVRFTDNRHPIHDHPITSGLADYDHDDELYELTADFVDRTNVVPLSGITVLAEAEGHPMVYVKTHGKGRVVYLASGHDARSLDQPTFRTLFNRAVAWAAPTQSH